MGQPTYNIYLKYAPPKLDIWSPSAASVAANTPWQLYATGIIMQDWFNPVRLSNYGNLLHRLHPSIRPTPGWRL